MKTICQLRFSLCVRITLRYHSMGEVHIEGRGAIYHLPSRVGLCEAFFGWSGGRDESGSDWGREYVRTRDDASSDTSRHTSEYRQGGTHVSPPFTSSAVVLLSRSPVIAQKRSPNAEGGKGI